MNYDQSCEMLARMLCRIVGINAIEPSDGSPNWWMFRDDAAKWLEELRPRFPSIPPKLVVSE